MGVLFEEQRVLNPGIAGVHGAFEDNDVLRLPHFQNRHPGDWTTWVILCRRVNGVVSPDNQDGVGVGEIIVDLVHLQHDVVRHFRFRQQHVHVAWQTPRHRVDAKAHLDAARAQLLGDFSNRILRLRHRHAIAWGDDDRMRVFQHLCCIFRADLTMLAHFFVSAGRGTVRAKTAGDNADERTVHRLTHDVGQNRTGRAHQRTGDDQQVVAQHKASRRGCPTGVGVEH